jgi:hypothetical protein
LAAAAISWSLIRSIDEQIAPLPLLALSIVASYLITFATVWISPHGRMFLTDLFRLIKTGRAQG